MHKGAPNTTSNTPSNPKGGKKKDITKRKNEEIKKMKKDLKELNMDLQECYDEKSKMETELIWTLQNRELRLKGESRSQILLPMHQF